MSVLFDGWMHLPFGDEPVAMQLAKQPVWEAASPPITDHLVSKLLLYDRVVIPTVDMRVVPCLCVLWGPRHSFLTFNGG
jgi:hypothetical protein